MFTQWIARLRIPCFGRTEYLLWGGSAALIVAAFAAFGGGSALSLAASLVGVTSLIFNAKGHPVGQALMMLFSVLYGIISYSYAYYGEMITYLGMTAPMAAAALVAWLRHPYSGAQVRVNPRISGRERIAAAVLTAAVTAGGYFMLRALGNANLAPSTVSVATSFWAAYLTLRRSAWFALAYAANDVVLIVLWGMAAAQDASYTAVLVCFVLFLANDLYGFRCWLRMRTAQGA